MDFITLCQRTAEKAGIPGGVPTAITNQTGESLRVVNWVNDAWEAIQNRRKSWLWMKQTKTFSTVLGTRTYSLTDLSLNTVPFGRWLEKSFRIYLTSAGQGGERRLTWCPYEDFRNYYLFGSINALQSLPIEFTIGPDRSLTLGPIPDGIYTVTGEYQLGAARMAANADTPGMPAQFHMLIVWEALKLYALYESAQEALEAARRGAGALWDELEDNQLDPMLGPPPLV
jgi:hypothetical protein